MKFYILRKNETIRKQHDLRICPCKCWRQYWNRGLYIASLPTHRWVLMPTWPPWSGKSATSLAYQNDCFPPVQTTGQLGGCSHTRRKLVATYKRFCYVLQNYWVSETLVPGFLVQYIFFVCLRPKGGCLRVCRVILIYDI